MRYSLVLPALCLFASTAQAQTSNAISVVGDGQELLIDQSDAVSGSVLVQQIGNANGVQIRQADTDSSADVAINGSDQRHEISQEGNGENQAILSSFGTGNTSQISQQSAVGGLNSLALLQDGTNNRAELEQQTTAAGLNRIDLIQSGNDNAARLVQNGVDNAIDLTQNGDTNAANITQTGNGLGFILTQTGGAQITVTQTTPGG